MNADEAAFFFFFFFPKGPQSQPDASGLVLGFCERSINIIIYIRVAARRAVSGETISSHYRGAPFIPGIATRRER